MFKENGGASSICYRIVNVNASIFYDNLKTFMCIKEKAETEIALIEEELTELLDSWRLEHIFLRIIIMSCLRRRHRLLQSDMWGCQQTYEFVLPAE